jgi:hypothetical protein
MQNRFDAGTRNSRTFALKVAIANSAAFLIGGLIPVFLDPKIVNHFRYGARIYPSWTGFSIALWALAVLFLTYVVLVESAPRIRTFIVDAPLLALSVPALFVLRPEFPHFAFFGEVALMALLTLIATWIHHYPVDEDFILDPAIDTTAKIEAIKEESGTWKTILTTAIVGYLTIVVVWFTTIQSINKDVTPERSEQFLLNGNAIILITFQSAWFVCGVLSEISRKRRQVVDLLKRIPREAQSKLDDSKPSERRSRWLRFKRRVS